MNVDVFGVGRLLWQSKFDHFQHEATPDVLAKLHGIALSVTEEIIDIKM